ncbi:MAG: hexitol phosphatase HxpB [Proteobacteria bacterium]|nr:MAG: hexitol phosphatase HxpB [Pseudomonadota bacterium]
MIQAVIFDMDGLLIDSEPFWKTADLEIYRRLGIDLEKHLNHETTGLRVDAAVQHWYQKFPWQGRTLLEVEGDIIDRVEELMAAGATPKKGAIELVQRLHAAKIPLAVCSSSPLRLIQVALKKIGLIDFFSVLHSAEHEEYGKPHPAAYLSTARLMGIDPSGILVFEDSIIGSISGKAARMKVVAVPEEHYISSTKFDFCDGKISSLAEFDVEAFLKTRGLESKR